MKRVLARIVTILVVLSALGWLVASKLVSQSEKASGAQKKKESGPKEVLVTTHEVTPETIVNAISTVGTLRPDESIDVQNEVQGKVVRIGFDEGERVERGQMLLQMRRETLQAELEVKRQQKALVETQVERQRKVLKKGGISQQEFDVTQNRLDVLEAEMERIRAELDKRTVRAPFDGVAGLRSVSRGAIIGANTTVAELVKIDPIELEFTVPERYAGSIETGDSVRFRVHGSERIHRAEIFALDPTLDAGNRVLEVRARTDNPDRALRPGAYAQVRLSIGEIEGALTVPATTVITSGDRRSLWVRVDGKAKKRSVETGIRTENRVQITDGLSAGDEVVVTGRQNVQPDAPLKVDTSEDAMDVDAIEPDPDKPGMRNKWFSEEPLESASDDGDSESPEPAPETSDDAADAADEED